MNPSSSSFFEKAYNPVLQAGLLLVAVIVFILVGKLVNAIGLLEVGVKFPWMTASAFLLLFAVFNSIFSLASENLNQYWSRSIPSFAVLAVGSALIAYVASSLSISEAGSYRWIFIVVTFGYLVFLSMMGFMKQIVEFAQKEEWNQPRIRRKGKKRK